MFCTPVILDAKCLHSTCVYTTLWRDGWDSFLLICIIMYLDFIFTRVLLKAKAFLLSSIYIYRFFLMLDSQSYVICLFALHIWPQAANPNLTGKAGRNGCHSSGFVCFLLFVHFVELWMCICLWLCLLCFMFLLCPYWYLIWIRWSLWWFFTKVCSFEWWHLVVVWGVCPSWGTDSLSILTLQWRQRHGVKRKCLSE